MNSIKYYPRIPSPTPESATPLGDTSGRDIFELANLKRKANAFQTMVQELTFSVSVFNYVQAQSHMWRFLVILSELSLTRSHS